VTSPKKTEANRRNAKRSTGPKTPEGKAKTSRNAVKHGALAVVPVLRGMEVSEEWEAHLRGVRSSLSPVGYLEEVLVDRIALLLWRMGRVARFELEALVTGIETAERAVNEEGRREGWDDEATAQGTIRRADATFRFFDRVGKGKPEDEVDGVEADAALYYLETSTAHRREVGTVVSVPGLPDDDDERGDFDGWTVGLVEAAVDAYGKAAGWTRDMVMESAAAWAVHEKKDAERVLRQRVVALERKKRERLLLEPETMDRVLKYETTMERAFLRTLHELERLQASRAGGHVPPPVVVDLSVSGGGMEP